MPKKENEQGFTTSQYPGVACYDGEVPFPGKAGKHAGKMNGKCKCTNPARPEHNPRLPQCGAHS